MERTRTLLTLSAAALLAAGVWTIADAGPISPPGSPAPTPTTLEALDARIDAVADAVAQGNGSPPIAGFSVFISSINGEEMGGRIAVANMSYTIGTPIVQIGGPGGGQTSAARVEAFEFELTERDRAAVPLFFAALRGMSLNTLRFDLCPMPGGGGGAPNPDDCFLTYELEGVRVLSVGATESDSSSTSYTLFPTRVKTIFREQPGDGGPVMIFEHAWDYETQLPF